MKFARVAVWLVLLGVITACTWRDYDSFQVGAYLDDAKYAHLARTIASGEEYSLRTGPGPAMTTSYPFVFPLVLSAVARLDPGDPAAGRVLSLLATLIAASLIFWGWPLVVPGAARFWGPLVAFLYGLSPATLAHARMLMTEALFTALSLGALMMTESCVRRGQSASATRFAILGLLLAATWFCRIIGVSLVVAVVVRLLWVRGSVPRRGWVALSAAILALPIGVAGATSYTVGDLIPSKALKRFRQPSSTPGLDVGEDSLLQRIGWSAAAYGGREIRLALIPAGGGEREQRLATVLGMPSLPALVAWSVSGLVLIGYALQFRGAGMSPTALLFQGLFAAILLAWPFRLPRFLVPIQPLLVYQLLCAVGWLAALGVGPLLGRRDRAGRVAVIAVAAAACGLLVASVWNAASPAQDTRVHVRDFEIEARWLRDNTAPAALVLGLESITVRLRTGRPTIDARFFGSRQSIERAITEFEVDYFLIGPAVDWRNSGAPQYDRFTAEILLPAAEQLTRSGRLELAFSSTPADKVRIYRVRRVPSAPAPDC
jgi:hypothetical protein